MWQHLGSAAGGGVLGGDVTTVHLSLHTVEKAAEMSDSDGSDTFHEAGGHYEASPVYQGVVKPYIYESAVPREEDYT